MYTDPRDRLAEQLNKRVENLTQAVETLIAATVVDLAHEHGLMPYEAVQRVREMREIMFPENSASKRSGF